MLSASIILRVDLIVNVAAIVLNSSVSHCHCCHFYFSALGIPHQLQFWWHFIPIADSGAFKCIRGSIPSNLSFNLSTRATDKWNCSRCNLSVLIWALYCWWQMNWGRDAPFRTHLSCCNFKMDLCIHIASAKCTQKFCNLSFNLTFWQEISQDPRLRVTKFV